MPKQFDKEIPQIAIYYCGGTGLNIGAEFTKVLEGSELLHDAVTQYFVDTSTANHKDGNTAANTKVIGTKKGSGKRRDVNYANLRDSVPDILHTFTPGRFNILVAGSSGGSGSVIQGVLLSELLGDDQSVMCVTVGSMDSDTEVYNSRQTFLSYQSVAKTRKRPAVVHYRENGTDGTLGEINENMLATLTRLCLMFACHAEKIDESDLRHFLDYPKVREFPVGLVGLELSDGDMQLRDHEAVFSVTTLARRDVSTVFSPAPPYQSVGFIDGSAADALGETGRLHFAVIGGAYSGLIPRLIEIDDDNRSKAATFRDKDYSGGQDSEADGMLI